MSTHVRVFGGWCPCGGDVSRKIHRVGSKKKQIGERWKCLRCGAKTLITFAELKEGAGSIPDNPTVEAAVNEIWWKQVRRLLNERLGPTALAKVLREGRVDKTPEAFSMSGTRPTTYRLWACRSQR